MKWGTGATILLLLLSLFFNVYIIDKYFTKDWRSWNGFSNFSKTGIGAVYICIHWVGGFIINILGSFQILSKTGFWNGGFSKWHVYTGRIYLLATILTCLGGLLFVFQIRTAGGWQMDTSFTIYGLLMILTGIKTWTYAGKNTQLHYEWALRLYSIGIGSMIYRILVFPVYIADKDSFSSVDEFEDWASNYLVTASWFFYVPNLIAAEFIIQYYRMIDQSRYVVEESLNETEESDQDLNP